MLLRRSTRRLALTEPGRIFHEGCLAMVAAARHAREQIASLQEAPVGELSLSCPAGFAESHLIEALRPMLVEHPGLRLRLIVTDDRVNVVRDGIDLAVAIGAPMPSPGLVRRHLADWPLVLCASPDYLARRGTPRTPAALAGHDFLSLPAEHHRRDGLTGPRQRRVRLALEPRIVSNNHFVVKQFVLAGGGIAFHAEPEIAEELASGRLVRVLPQWCPATVSVDALMSAQRPQPAKIRAAVAALAGHLSSLPAGRAGGRGSRDKAPGKLTAAALP